ncbi:hypothetical protein SESBI_03795 [Sesbania bispinosa]|nr:hypothetical protein SESBI_03795 [Sesbania bispinosa]
MGTALLRSHDCLQSRLRHDASSLATSSVRSQRNSNPNPNQTRRGKRSRPAVHPNFQDRDRSRSGVDQSCVVVKLPGANLVMGQVKILKRGEKLSPEDTTKKSEEGFDLVLGSTDRLGPDPETVQKQVRVPDLTEGIYAGPTSLASPPPSSLPVPGFLGKKSGTITGDLRRLLPVIN